MALIKAIFTRPSQRTLFEAQLIGLSVFLICSIATPVYMIFFTDSSTWLKIIIGFSGVSLFLMMFANLSTTYLQYYTYKLHMGLYPKDKKLQFKINEAKEIVEELKELIGDAENEMV